MYSMLNLVCELEPLATGNSASRAPSLDEMPPLVLQAFAYALAYLKQFRLEAVLRQGRAFREFSEASEIALAPNALR